MQHQELTLTNGEVIPYLLEHRQRKTVGLKITNQGLIVHAPKRIFKYQLNQILQEKSGWIITKLAQRKESQVDPIVWQTGESLLYLGQTIKLNIQTSKTNQMPKLAGDVLMLALANQSQAFIQRKVIQWYQKEAKQDFARRLALFAAKLGVPTPPLALSNAKMRWGSCNSRGEIRLNWRLMQAPPSMINYVVCHELAHLKEMNHSAKFYAVLKQLYGEYKTIEKEIKQLSAQLHRVD